MERALALTVISLRKSLAGVLLLLFAGGIASALWFANCEPPPSTVADGLAPAVTTPAAASPRAAVAAPVERQLERSASGDSVETPGPHPEGTYYVSGWITSAGRAPLAGAHVSGRLRSLTAEPGLPDAAFGDAQPQVTDSDVQGRFRLGPFPAGTIEVTVEHPFHLTFARRYASDASALDVTLEPAAAVHGVVLDPEGRQPTVIQRVVLLSADPGRRTMRVVGETVPDAADAAVGRFHVPVPTQREVHLVAVTRDHALARTGPFQVPRGTLQGPLQLCADRGAPIAGVVCDETGTPVADARIEVREDGSVFALARTTSDAQGAFVCGFLAPGRYLLRLDKQGCSAHQQRIDVPGTLAPQTVECRLVRGAAVTGLVLHAVGAVLPATQVLAVRVDDAGSAPEIANVRAGAFAFDFLVPGEYRILLRENGDNTLSAGGTPVRLARGAVVRLDLSPQESGLGSLRARVVSSGAARAFATVHVTRALGRRVATCTTDRDGAFEIAGLAVGPVSLTVTHGTSGPVLARRQLEVRSGTAAAETIDVAIGSLAGSVIDAANGLPLAGVRIEVVDADGQVLATAVSDRAGRYDLPMVQTGEWALQFVRDGMAPIRGAKVQIVADQRSDARVVQI